MDSDKSVNTDRWQKWRLDRVAITVEAALVVLAVISSAMVVMPVCSKSKADSYAKACLSNMKQIGEAVAMYADDNNQALVPLVTGERTLESPNFKNRKYWRLLLRPYLKSAQVFICPTLAPSAASWGPPSEDVAGNYAINSDAGSNDSDWNGVFVRKKSQFSDPAKLILGTEARNGVYLTGYWMLNKQYIGSYAAYYHSNKTVILFLDGHAKIMYLWDTVGSVPREWLWSDPAVGYPSESDIAILQRQIRTQWPRNIPKP